MGTDTKIEWTGATWNPVVGCTKVSPGCKNCYAERMAGRQAGMEYARFQKNTDAYEATCGFEGGKYSNVVNSKGKWNGKVYCDESALEKPLHWRKSRMIFVCSMSDLFHKDVPFDFIDRVFQTAALCWGNQSYRRNSYPNHTFQILTKRPERMAKYMSGDVLRRWGGGAPIFGPLQNVWLGVTAENQEQANKRIPILLQIPAAMRFVSIEPMLGPVDVSWIWRNHDPLIDKILDGVIVGGESGPKARPMHPDWVRGVRDQCVAAGVPFFFKQWGEWIPSNHLQYIRPEYRKLLIHRWKSGFSYRVTKKKAGRLLDGRKWSEFPKGR